LIRLARPSIGEEDFEAVREVLASGFLVQGARVAAFEESVAQYVGVKHAIAVSSGTAALHLALLSLGIQSGDLVVVTAYSFVATANVIELCGARPVFVDIDGDTFNLDPECLEQVLAHLTRKKETAGRVKAVLPVHTFGQLADMPSILEIASRYGIPVVEDAACALGATLHERQAGTWGGLGCFSFHPRKAITTGEGGMVVTDDARLARLLRALRNHGQDPDAVAPDFILPGLNYRMTEFQAALGCVQLSKLEWILSKRRELAANYDRLLADSAFTAPSVPSGGNPVFQSYVVLMPEDASERREECIRYLRERDIETTIGTWHMPLTSYLRAAYGHKAGDFPVTDLVFSRSLALPLHQALEHAEQEHVIRVLETWYGQA
jgi:dTDP-4-amino-4,6-dideoxygalactose transaminase